jgi:hypothetical protein
MGDESSVRPDAAYHEAGHAVVALAQGVRVKQVWIDEQGRGHTETVKGPGFDIEGAKGKTGRKAVLRRALTVHVAGHVASYLHDQRERFLCWPTARQIRDETEGGWDTSSDSLVSRRFTARESRPPSEDVAQAAITVMGIMLYDADFGPSPAIQEEVPEEEGLPEIIRAERRAE